MDHEIEKKLQDNWQAARSKILSNFDGGKRENPLPGGPMQSTNIADLHIPKRFREPLDIQRITTLQELATYTEKEIVKWPKYRYGFLGCLKRIMQFHGLSFAP